MKCNDFSTALVCYNDGVSAPQTLVAHYEYRSDALGNAVLHATRYTESDGVTVVDTSAGTVSAGQCALVPPDIEWEQLCDVQGDGSVIEFLRRSITSFDGLGVATVTVTDWELDKATAYSVTGTVAACNQDCDPVAPVGVVTAWG